VRYGELVQWDTSEHDWLEGRGEKLYLIAMIDIRRYSREEALEFYEQIKGTSPRQQFAFLMGSPRYLSRTWPGEVAAGDASRGQWGETVKRFLTAA
jgi:hypothetical protein